ncbi:MAG: hypothetical protein ACK2UE_09830 [Anaerolineales bacterium]
MSAQLLAGRTDLTIPFNRDSQLADPILPERIEICWDFDMAGYRSIQCSLLLNFLNQESSFRFSRAVTQPVRMRRNQPPS